MKVNAIAVNDTQFYAIQPEDRPFIKAIYSVFQYTPEERTFCCEITPSYALEFLYSTVETTLDTPDDKREELGARYGFEPSDDTYMHCYRVDAWPAEFKKECGEFESLEESREYLQGNCPF